MAHDQRITYAQFLRELQQLDPAMRRLGKASRLHWLVGLAEWAAEADSEAAAGLPGDLASPDAMEWRNDGREDSGVAGPLADDPT
jgi:hypothetical protein